MKKGQEILLESPEIFIVHQKIPNSQVDNHSHEEHEFIIPLQGEFKILADETTFHCGPGRMIYLPPKLEHQFDSSAAGEGERIIFLIPDSAFKDLDLSNTKPIVFPLNSLVRELVFYILLNPRSKHSKTFVKALAESLSELLNFQKEIQEDDWELLSLKAKDDRVKAAIEKVKNNININVTELSKECRMSPRNMNKLFLQDLGTTPKKYIIQNKIQLAKKLLVSTDQSVTDIALEVGYNSLSKFISSFHKIVGELPSHYRLNFKKNLDQQN